MPKLGPVRAVSHSVRIARAILAALLLLAVPCLPLAAAELTEETLQAFEAYVASNEVRLDRDLAGQGPFLCMNAERHTKREAIEKALQRGQVSIHRVNGNNAEVPGGYIHHWVAVTFVPHADVELAGAVSMDYDGYQRFHRPYVLDSKLIERDGHQARFKLRLEFRKLMVRVVLDTEHEMQCYRLEGGRARARTATAQVRQVARPGEESEELVGDDDDRNEGFLWRHRSYWRFQEGTLSGEEGTFVQYESVALSRKLPIWPLGNLLKQSHKEFAQDLLSNAGKAMRELIDAPNPTLVSANRGCLMTARARLARISH